MKLCSSVFSLLLFAFTLCAAQENDLTRYVDPFIGTGGSGHTYPGASMPFGMVQLSPDTRTEGWNAASGYYYDDSTILGFSHTHLSGTGVGDYGDIRFMPTVGPVRGIPGVAGQPGTGYRSGFRHAAETASPGYYSVHLDDYNVQAEFTVTPRAGFHRYTFPKTDNANVIIDLLRGSSEEKILDLYVKFVGDNEIEGYRRSNGWAEDQIAYFVARFSRPFTGSGIFVNGVPHQGEHEARGKNLVAYASFATSDQEQVLVKVGISAVDVNGARRNLAKEIPDWNFEKARANAKAAWNTALSKIAVETASQEQKTVFYTAMYHVMLTPNLFMDVDKRYRGMDHKTHTAKGFDNYTVFSLWDTFRAEHPLFTIIEPKRTVDFVNTILHKYSEGGLLPVWELAGNETFCMIGYHAVPVIVDAYMKGYRGFDASLALKAMEHSASETANGLFYYRQSGYVPMDKEGESVSKTLEYVYDDWCIAQMAKALGKKNDYKQYSDRALFYQNLFDASTGFMRGRKSDGTWRKQFDPFEVSGDYTEANAWQYSLFVPHDVNGLMRLYGGPDKMVAMLDSLFTVQPQLKGNAPSDISGLIGQYAHGNEPSHHMAYLYTYAGAPWKTQDMVRRTLETLYAAKPDGLSGNDDCGQMSAWYVLSSMGFYSVCPGTDEYVFGVPMFEKATINPGNGKKFVVRAENFSAANKYIQSVRLNGKPYTKTFIRHADITKGGELVFVMGASPNTAWGTGQSNLPYSLNRTSTVAMPFVSTDAECFVDTATVTIQPRTDGSEVRYTLNGAEPTKSSPLYTQPLRLSSSVTLKAKGFKKGLEESLTAEIPYSCLNSKTNGLNYTYYEGSNWSTLPDFSSLTPLNKGLVYSFDLRSVKQRPDQWAALFSGFIRIVRGGEYLFTTNSDDGSKLIIDGTTVVDNDGSHSTRERSGKVTLKPGMHAIQVQYFDDSEGETLDVFIAGPGMAKQKLPPAMLFRSNEVASTDLSH